MTTLQKPHFLNKKYKKSLFIFRRDLRLDDNTGLLTLLEQSEKVIPAFILDPEQADKSKNEYFSDPAFYFMLNSFKELDQSLKDLGSKLHVFSGEPTGIIKSLITQDNIEAIFVNRDYTPFSQKRDKKIAELCNSLGKVFKQYDDIPLSPIQDIRTKQGKIYSVFTPFKNNAACYLPEPPRKNNFSNYYSSKLKNKTISLNDILADTGKRVMILKGGREEGLSLLKNNGYLDNYKDRRDLPAEPGTSKLSAHHKFGTISIRESYYFAAAYSGPDSTFITQMYWRDFYYYIALHFPLVFQKSFLNWAQYIEWINDKNQFKAWCNGKTGVPIVDAGMRQLNYTGWMHNRVRMITASFLTKNLLINWQWGEKYFAQNLIDYDPAQNNGGWQWSASTGADPRPLRIFNPYTQVKKFDSRAEYIKKWVPELKQVDSKLLTDNKTQDFSKLATGYPAPLIDQKKSYYRARAVYKNAKELWRMVARD